MISIARPSCRAARRAVARKNPSADCQDLFLALLPAIRRHAQFRLRRLDSESRDDAIASVIAHAWAFFVTLARSGREQLAYPEPLARYGIARTLEGRQVGNQLNVHDATSRWCQRRKGVRIEPLLHQEPNGEWQEILVEDQRALPSDLAAMRIDFPAWLKTLSRQQRRVAQCLARGESTRVVAQMFQLSPGRISQMRGEFRQAWMRFQGECGTESVTKSPCA
jgi:hypothetical protein